jgi:spore coat protein U-like protein
MISKLVPRFKPMRAAILIAASLGGFLFQEATAQAGTATNNLTVTMTITASCTINAATLTFPSTPGTSLTSSAVTANTTVSVTCTNSSPYAIGMGQGNNYSSGNRMANGTNFLPYGLYVDSGYTHPWTTAASSTTCTTANDCYLGTGTGSAQSIPIYGQVPTTATAPVPGTYSDTVLMTITY